MAGARLREVSPDELAFVQFSSGSTSFPKGVPITQRNLLANVRMIIQNDARTEVDRGWGAITLRVKGYTPIKGERLTSFQYQASGIDPESSKMRFDVLVPLLKREEPK